jgi:hypothetical protein
VAWITELSYAAMGFVLDDILYANTSNHCDDLNCAKYSWRLVTGTHMKSGASTNSGFIAISFYASANFSALRSGILTAESRRLATMTGSRSSVESFSGISAINSFTA